MVHVVARSLGLLALLGPLLLAGCGGETPTVVPSAGPPPSTDDAPADAARRPPTVDTPWRGEGRELRVSVWEMHCAGCELEVEEVLKAVPGVADARAYWETSEVVIQLEETTPRDDVIAGIREAVHANERIVLGEDAVGP